MKLARTQTSAVAQRWYGLALLTLVATLNSLDKTLVPAMAEPIKHEFGLSDTQFGLVAGLIYSAGFVIGGIPLTLFVDRAGRTRLLALLLAIWSGATGLSAIAGSYAHLAAARFAVGAAEVGGQPISMALIGGWFPKERRGTALGIWSFSRSIALVASFAFGGYAAVHCGWRNAFLLAGIPGLILSLVILTTLPDAPAEPSAAIIKPVQRDILRAFMRDRPLFLLSAALTLAVGCQNGVMAFLSSLLTRSHALPVDRAGLFGGTILGIGAGIGMPLGGILSDLFGRGAIRRQYRLVAALLFLAAPAGLVGLLAHGPELAIAGLFFFELVTSCAYTAGLSTYLNAVPQELRGSLSSLLTILVIFLGAGLGPTAAGFASDKLGSLGIGLSATMVEMLAAGALVLLALRPSRSLLMSGSA